MSDFSDLYQEILLDHYKNPRNKATLDSADIVIHENPTCGDSVKVVIDTDTTGLVTTVQFDGHGCAISMASASMMTELLAGKSIQTALHDIKRFASILRGEEDLALLDEWGDVAALKGVIAYPVRVKCATLAWHAAKQELEKRNSKGQP